MEEVRGCSSDKEFDWVLAKYIHTGDRFIDSSLDTLRGTVVDYVDGAGVIRYRSRQKAFARSTVSDVFLKHLGLKGFSGIVRQVN